MGLPATNWKKLFIFCLGLSLAALLCMKWLEADFTSSGEKFGIMGLELFYSKERLAAVLAGIDDHARVALNYHLYFDFVLMAGVYPAIASLCMIAGDKAGRSGLRTTLFILACLQLLAWASDITENTYLLRWLQHPRIGGDFGLYHAIVSAKWMLALTAFLISLGILLVRTRINTRKPIS